MMSVSQIQYTSFLVLYRYHELNLICLHMCIEGNVSWNCMHNRFILDFWADDLIPSQLLNDHFTCKVSLGLLLIIPAADVSKVTILLCAGFIGSLMLFQSPVGFQYCKVQCNRILNNDVVNFNDRGGTLIKLCTHKRQAVTEPIR